MQRGRENGRQKKTTDGPGRAEIVSGLLKKMEEKLGADPGKATLVDYIRLVQLQKELEDEEPRDITVQWVETATETLEPEK